MNSSSRRRSRHGWGLRPQWIVVIVTLLVYASMFRGEFIFDDYDSIIANEDIHSLQYDRIRTTYGVTRQVVAISIAANYAVGGLQIFGYHAVNLLIHLFASLAVYELVGRLLVRSRWVRLARRGNLLLRKRHAWVCLIAACIFALHPLQTSAVTYITQRAESLASLFYLLTIVTMIRSSGVRGEIRIRWCIASAFCLTLALFSKEFAITAPAVACVLDRLFVAKSWTRLMGSRWPLYVLYCLPLAVMLALLTPKLQLTRIANTDTVRVDLSEDQVRANQRASQDERQSIPILETIRRRASSIDDPVIRARRGITRVEFLRSQPRVMFRYLRLFIWPTGQCLDYQWQPEPPGRSILPMALPIFLLCGMGSLAILVPERRSQRRRSGIAQILAIAPLYFLIHSPRSTFQVLDLAVEYRMYLPIACLAGLTAVFLDYFIGFSVNRFSVSRQSAYAVAFAVIIMPLSVQTIRRNQLFHSRLAMWQDCITQSPLNARAHRTVAGGLAEAGRLDEALAQAKVATALLEKPYVQQIDPGLIYRSLGDRQLALGQIRLAEVSYLRAFRLSPGVSSVYDGLANVARANGNDDEAEELQQYATQLRSLTNAPFEG